MEKYVQIYNYPLEEDELGLIRHLVPEYYIDKNIDKNEISVEYVIRFLQNNLNYLLGLFLNGGFSYMGFALYPFVKDLSKENTRKIKRLKKVAVFLNNNGYDFSKSIKKFKERIQSKDFAEIISSLYKDFSLIKNKSTNSIKKAKCKELCIDTYKKSDLIYLKPLHKLKNYANANLKQYLSGFYLHGSLATKDYIKGWSDIDSLSVVSKKSIESPRALLELRNKFYFMRYFFYQIDPLQHHGSMIISEYDLGNYCQAYFPVPVFNYAKSFFKNDKINEFYARDFSSEAVKNLFWFVSYFRRLNIEKNFNLGSYDTKVLLHSITLFPTLYLQTRGILVYKKFSFDIAKKDFKKSDWEVIDNVSSIRSNWKEFRVAPLIRLCSNINPLLFYQLNSRLMDFFKMRNKIYTKNLIENMFNLSEETWSKVKQNNKMAK